MKLHHFAAQKHISISFFISHTKSLFLESNITHDITQKNHSSSRYNFMYLLYLTFILSISYFHIFYKYIPHKISIHTSHISLNSMSYKVIIYKIHIQQSIYIYFLYILQTPYLTKHIYFLPSPYISKRYQTLFQEHVTN